jgi:hypothetical protein
MRSGDQRESDNSRCKCQSAHDPFPRRPRTCKRNAPRIVPGATT